jgi:alcohol oxidase
VLLIEAGADNYGNPTIIHPALYVTHLVPDSPSMQFLKGKASSAIADRELVIPHAKILGGGSSVNLQMYSRAQRCDFDAWNTPGWSADDMLAKMRKVLILYCSLPTELGWVTEECSVI